MATAKKVNKAEQIRAYQSKNPEAGAIKVAKACGTTPAYVYALRASDKGKAAKTPKKEDWKTVMLATSKKAMVKHLGVTMAKDDVTKLTEEQTARLIFNNTQGRQRLQAANNFVEMIEPQADNVNHPAHYKVGGIETIDFIEAKGLNYHLGNVVKYITRADTKGNREEDLLKARWYLNREIAKFAK
jgi:hypothetical protein